MQVRWQHLSDKKSLPPLATFVQGTSEDGCSLAVSFVRGRRRDVRGLLLVGQATLNLEPMQPETALAISWCVPSKDAASIPLRDQIKMLTERGYPVVRENLEGDSPYLLPSHMQHIRQWLDWVTAL
jgi:hypothetical protein